MCSTVVLDRDAEVDAALDTLQSALIVLHNTDWQGVSLRGRVRAMQRLETFGRRQAATSTEVLGSLLSEEPARLGGTVHEVVANRLRITPAEVRRRIRDVEQLGPRMAMTGQPLAPLLPATARQWRAGLLDARHIAIIERFFRDLPASTPVARQESAEEFLADKAGQLRPDQFAKVAERLAAVLNEDGSYSDADRARKRGFSWGPQGPDGMSKGTLVAGPQLRADLDAWFARFAAKGMCNPDDETATVHGQPPEAAVNCDSRTPGQRRHDALSALVHGQLGDPKLGTHHGLPTTVVVSTTLRELQAAAGLAVTATGTLIPMSELIRRARHAYHYLAVFDDCSGRALWLGRSKRVASADQRIVLHSLDRGCTAPGCDKPGFATQVHHIDEWAVGGLTNIDDLTFACNRHHPLLDRGWRTRKLPNGTVEWIAPPQLEIRPAVNDFHHPERLLPEIDGDPVEPRPPEPADDS